MKKLLLILFIFSYSFISKGAIHQIQVWNGYYQFLPPNNITVQLGDTIQWTPLDPPTMTHTITSDSIPAGATAFNQIWQLPANTFFQYIPQVVGLYKYVCTPHINFNMIGEFTVVNGTNSQYTYVPDDNFEAYLEANGMGNGIANDDSVTTANINGVTQLFINNLNIVDLTVTGNPISTITQNGIDLEVTISDAYIWNTSATTQTITPTVNGWYWCVVTDANGCIGDTAFYEVTNIVSAINELGNSDSKLLKITDMLGQETPYRRNTPLFYIYDDGTVEKRIVVE